MKIIYEYHLGDDKDTIIEEGLTPEECAENINKVIKVLFKDTTVHVIKKEG